MDKVHLDLSKGIPEVTITCYHPQWYGYVFKLIKPPGQTWSDGKTWKEIRSGTFDQSHEATDTFSIGYPATELVKGYDLYWEVYIKVPGGGNGQYGVNTEIKQDGVANPDSPFSDNGTISNKKLVVRRANLVNP
jgi:hypothetical protein